MSTDKKEYRAALETLNGMHTPSQFHTKLNKLFINSEDEQFRMHLLAVMKVLQQHHGIAVAKKLASVATTIRFTDEPHLSLVKYCRQQLDSAKPQWQILAERHGWQPKSES